MRAHIGKRKNRRPKVLLIVGGRFTNAIGDTVNFSYHARYLAAGLGPIQVTTLTSDASLWRILCGKTISSTPFISKQQATHGHDLLVFDWVTVDQSVERLFSGSDAILLEILRDSSLRYRLGDSRWTFLRLPPTTNHYRRLESAYERLGVDMSRVEMPTGKPAKSDLKKIFLNPYASTAAKCLDHNLLDALIDRLTVESCGYEMIAPSIPNHVPPGESRSFSRLAKIITRASKRGVIRQLDLGVAEYVTCIRSVALVIGPDTSSQHIANYYGVPSIACYPSTAGYRYYFWGCPGPMNLCFNTPSAEKIDSIRDLASLVSSMAAVLLSKSCWPRPDKSPTAESCDRYLTTLRAVACGRLTAEEGVQEAEKTLTEMRAVVPDNWTDFVFPELIRLAQEVYSRAKQRKSRGKDNLTVERLSDVFALKTVRCLSLLPIVLLSRPDRPIRKGGRHATPV
jgi:hypothetical protein